MSNAPAYKNWKQKGPLLEFFDSATGGLDMLAWEWHIIREVIHEFEEKEKNEKEPK